MKDKKSIKIEMFFTLTCPNCRIMKHMLDELLPGFGDKFELNRINASMPVGMIRSMKLGIHAVPALLIDNELVFRSVPTKKELVEKLNSY